MSEAEATRYAERPTLVAARAPQSRILDEVIAATQQRGFDIDAYHVMDGRDSAMIEQELMYGSGSSKFVYRFKPDSGPEVTGISVVGARHLASEYGGIKHRLVSSQRKKGAMFVFTTYAAPGIRPDVDVKHIPALTEEDDGYTATIEITDIKTGNVVMAEVFESEYGLGKNGRYLKPHYVKIAQSKAYRNGVLSILPQDVQLKWKQKMLELGKDVIITNDVLAEKRSAVVRYATRSGVPISREAVEGLSMDQIGGLSEAAHDGKLAMFTQSARALGLLPSEESVEAGPQQSQRQQTAQRAAKAKQEDGPPKGHPASSDPQDGQTALGSLMADFEHCQTRTDALATERNPAVMKKIGELPSADRTKFEAWVETLKSSLPEAAAA